MFINSHWVTESVNHSTYFTASFLSVSGDFILRDNHLTSLDKHKQPSTPAGAGTNKTTDRERARETPGWSKRSDLINNHLQDTLCFTAEGCMLGKAVSRINWFLFSRKSSHSVGLGGENSQSEAGRMNQAFRRYENTMTFTIRANERSASALVLLDLSSDLSVWKIPVISDKQPNEPKDDCISFPR